MRMYAILVVGGGYLGTRIAQYFKSKKQRVFVTTRSPAKAEFFKSQEIEPALCDLTQPQTLTDIPAAHFVVLCVAPDQRTKEAYETIYEKGVENILNALRRHARPSLILHVSSTSVWNDKGGAWVDETTAPDGNTEFSRILLGSEALSLKSGMPAAILRLSGIYGPGRNRMSSPHLIPPPAVRGEDRRGVTDGYMNMIHVDDAVAAIPILFKKAEEGAVYIGTDDTPVLRSDFYAWLKQKYPGVPGTKKRGEGIEGKRLSNRRLKALGFQPQYPSFKEGYRIL